jgi:hypothetical protein
MNKYLTLSLAAIVTQVMAADVVLSSGMGFNSNANAGNIGVVLNAEHQHEFSGETGYFVASNFFVSPAFAIQKAPISAGLVIGGTVKSKMAPVSAQIGLSVEVLNTETSSKYQIAPGIMMGGFYNMTDSWSIRTSSVFSFPSKELGVFEGYDNIISIGVAKSISMDA